MENDSGQSWRNIFWKSLGFGAGFALVVTLISGVWVWHANRPKPQGEWNTTAIKASYTDFLATQEKTQITFDWRYSLENFTDRDYRLPTDAKLMIRLPEDKSYRANSALLWEEHLYIPSRQKVNISIKLPIPYAYYNLSEKSATDEKTMQKFILRRMAETDGFALFDPSNRYQINFPNGWPDAKKHLEELESAEKSAKQ